MTKGQTVKVGESKNLAYQVLDAIGSPVTIDPTNVVWAVTSGDTFLKFTNGKAVGLKHGEASVVAIINGVASETVKVVVNPRAASRLHPAAYRRRSARSA